MKKLLLAGIAFAVLIDPALAADHAVRVHKRSRPVAVPVAVYNWTGSYIGLNAGGGWESTIDNSFTPGACTFPGPGACAALLGDVNAIFPAKFDTHPSGFIGGGQVGYNYQTGTFVWGIEADFQGANIKGRASSANSAAIAGFPQTLNLAGTGSQKIDWFGTLRGRLGWTPTSPWLIYVTGGLAYAHVQTDASFSASIVPAVATNNGATTVSQSNTRAGWTLGGGVEWMFAPRWSVKAEYLYYDLGTVILNQTLTTVASINGTFASYNIQSDAHYHGNIVRAGVNYHF